MQQFDGDIAIIGVASRDEQPAMEEFIARHQLEDMVTIADLDGEVWQRFGVVGQPAWVFLDGETGTGDRVLGALPRAEVERRIEELTG